MLKGDILVSPQHLSIDNRVLKKFFILLSDPVKTKTYVLAITTSQKKPWREDKKGCHAFSAGDGYYVFKKGDDWFDAETTWVLFESIETLTFGDVQKQVAQGNLQKINQLKGQNLQAVVNCVKSSPHINGFIIELITQ